MTQKLLEALKFCLSQINHNGFSHDYEYQHRDCDTCRQLEAARQALSSFESQPSG